MRYITIAGEKRVVPAYPHHKDFVYRSNIFFKANNLWELIAINGPSYALKRRWRQYVNGFPVPYLLLIDPTSACNLKCIGCWAADYDKRSELSYEKLDEVLTEAAQLGVYDILFSGGEPLMRKDDILRLCKKHKNLSFSMFTNGTLIDEKFADEMAKLGNLNAFISIEGFKEKTDFRRGEGTFDKVVKAMDILKSRDIGFGFSMCYHSKNYDEVSSDEFLDFLRGKGAWFGWMFNYMPIGNDADVSLMTEPEQRRLVKDRIQAYVKKYNLPIFDFANVGHLAYGCVAAGNDYTHINANGDVEPCAFFHYSDSNIHTKTLKESFASPFFKHFRQSKPKGNAYRPCPIMDDPEALLKITSFEGVKSTHLHNAEPASELYKKTIKAAHKWAPVAENIVKSMTEEEKKKIKLLHKYLLYRDKA